MKDSKEYRRYTKFFLAISFVLSMAIIAFNLIVDPYDLYRVVNIEGFNQAKVGVGSHTRLYKAVEIARQKPQALLLGTSRVMGGIDPSDVEAIINQRTYNAAFGGASFEETFHYFEHALYHQPNLKTVILGVDLFVFSKARQPSPDCSFKRLKTSGLIWSDIVASLFTKGALCHSYDTIYQNMNEAIIPFYANGLYNPLLFAKEKNETVARGDLDFVKRMFISSDFYRHFSLDESKIELFQRLVETCKAHGITLKIFLCPCKAIYWEALYRNHLGDALDLFKRRLSSIHPLWDFSGFNPITTEQVLFNGETYYYECSHFKPDLGKVIVRKMFQGSEDPPNFGVLLTPESNEKALEQIRDDRKTWLEKHQEIAQQLDQVLEGLH